MTLFVENQEASMDDEIVGYLFKADPTLRWQVLRDLAGAPEE